MHHEGGKIKTMNQNITVYYSWYGDYNHGFAANMPSLELGSSTATVINGVFYANYLPSLFDCGTSTIVCVIGGGASGFWGFASSEPAITFYNVTCTSTVYAASLSYANVSNVLTFNGPGYIYSDFYYLPNPPLINHAIFQKDGYFISKLNFGCDFNTLELAPGHTYTFNKTAEFTITPPSSPTAAQPATPTSPSKQTSTARRPPSEKMPEPTSPFPM